MTLYTLSHLCQAYASRTVLDIPHLAIEAGRIYALLGPNGAGKTTLLNLLGFLTRPSRGSVDFRSHRVEFNEKELQRLRRQVVLVDQHPILFTTTVFKNLEFGLKIRKVPAHKRATIISEALDMVGMKSFMASRAHLLSGGETQRVALARALALSPRVLLCDEPTSSVDVENQNTILNILRRINKTQEITVIFTTHDRTQAARIADHTLALDQGRPVQAAYENVFSARVGRDDNGRSWCTLHPQLTLTMDPRERVLNTTRLRIFIDPHGIEIADRDRSRISGNVIRGRVAQIHAENASITIVIDAHVRLTLALPVKIYRAARILAGDTIDCYVPPEAITVLKTTAP